MSHVDHQFDQILWHTVWPDVEFLSRECSTCGTMGKPLVTFGTFAPQAFCPNEDPAAWTWDPLLDPEHLRVNALVDPDL